MSCERQLYKTRVCFIRFKLQYFQETAALRLGNRKNVQGDEKSLQKSHRDVAYFRTA